jgi:hypothetical protein
MGQTPQDPSYTADDLPLLDTLHEAVGLGDLWKSSERRTEIERDDPLGDLIDRLHQRFKRPPTADEVMKFVYGNEWEKLVIWNCEKKDLTCQAKSPVVLTEA